MNKLSTQLTVLLLGLCMFVMLPLPHAKAIPAYPHPIRIIQSDGTYLTIRNYGDEFFHYRTTEDGYPIASKGGVYYHANYRADGTYQITSIKAADPGQRSANQRTALLGMSKTVLMQSQSTAQRVARTRAMMNNSSKTITKGQLKSIVILCNYKDIKFKTPKSHFEQIMNGSGKTAKQYFKDCSDNQFEPQFDIYGPVELPQNRAYYGVNGANGKDLRPQQMCIDAVTAVSRDLGVNLSQYDTDGNGDIDQVFLYFAGDNEAESGPAESIWPHRWAVFDPEFSIDGVQLWDYACGSELSYSNSQGGSVPATIGTLCHEFSHVLGLSDMYDTNGKTGGLVNGLGSWSLMGSGNYLDEGRTPPSYNAFERYQVGWITPEELKTDGNYSLDPINQSRKAYIFNTKNSNEFFIMENRVIEGWDAKLPQGGLFVYRVDMSNNNFVSMTAKTLWENNQPNAWVDHQCMYLIKANGNDNVSNPTIMSGAPFPGSTGRTYLDEADMKWNNQPNSLSWDKKRAFKLVNIKQEGTQIKFDFVNYYNVVVTGIELDKETASVGINQTIQLKATILPSDAGNQDIKWSAVPEGIVTVSDKGVVEGIAIGKAVVTATTVDQGKTATCEVEVTIPAPTDIKVAKAQTDALVTWKAGGNETKWVVEWAALDATSSLADTSVVSLYKDVQPVKVKRAEGIASDEPIKVSNKETQSITIEEPSIYITDLLPSTRYQVRIQAVLEDDSRSYFIPTEFTTNAINSTYPVLNVKGILTVGQKIYLGTSNMPAGSTVVWKINGTEETANEIALPAGDHEIRLEITTGDGTEVILKYVTVK